MIEGQEDVSWADWLALAQAAEEHGFEALMRSDHYLSVGGQVERGSLDAWGTICALAVVTERVRLGTLVSPATFRHPSNLAKLAVTAEQIAPGRIELGLGTGWNEPEHTAYGFAFPPMGERMDILAEQLEIVRRSWDEGAFTFEGAHYTVRDLDALPKPGTRPRLVMGGQARRRSAALAARWADEYNFVYASVDEVRERRANVIAACEAAGRDPATMTFSLMTGLTTDDGTLARLREYAEAGIERVMLQHLEHRDLDAVAWVGEHVVAAL